MRMYKYYTIIYIYKLYTFSIIPHELKETMLHI